MEEEDCWAGRASTCQALARGLWSRLGSVQSRQLSITGQAPTHSTQGWQASPLLSSRASLGRVTTGLAPPLPAEVLVTPLSACRGTFYVGETPDPQAEAHVGTRARRSRPRCAAWGMGPGEPRRSGRATPARRKVHTSRRTGVGLGFSSSESDAAGATARQGPGEQRCPRPRPHPA